MPSIDPLVIIPIITFTMAALLIQSAYLIPQTVTYHYTINDEPVTETRVFGPYWHVAFIGFIFAAFGGYVSYLIAKNAIEDYRQPNPSCRRGV